MADTVDPRINDEFTGIQLRLIQQRLDEKRERVHSAKSSTDDDSERLSPRARLQQSMRRRQELIERIKQEKELSTQLNRPHSAEMHRSYDQRISHSRQDHRAVSRQHQPVPHRLEPLQYSPRVQPPVVQLPYVINTAPPADGLRPVQIQNTATSTKQEMIEMMMMQNAQTHQMMMNHMMMSSLPGNKNKVDVTLEDIVSLRENRKGEVHHHHYDKPPQLPHINTQPQFPNITVYPQQTIKHYPTEVAPLQQPTLKVKKKKTKKPVNQPVIRWEPFQTKVNPVKKFVYPDLPFPGRRPLRRFRHAAYAVYFTKLLEKAIISPNFKKPKPFPDDFLFQIRLREIVAALHYQYLNPVGKIKRILDQVVSFNSKDLTFSLETANTYNKDRAEVLQDLAFILENVSFEITEIMPLTGVLGTHKKAVAYDMIKPAKLYPDPYLWDIEKSLLSFDLYGRTLNVDNNKAFILLSGCFIGRALVATLLLKPVEFGLVTVRPSFLVEGNLRLLATLFIYLLRKLYSSTTQPVQPPREIARLLFTDREIDELVKQLKKSFDYCEKLFRNWGTEYLKRLRKVQDTELGRLYTP